jgi:hypothetical protein
VSPEERGRAAFGKEIQVLFEVLLGNLDVVVGYSGLGDDGGIRTGGDDDSELHELLDRGKAELVVLNEAVWQDRLGNFSKCSLIGIKPEHLLREQMGFESPDESIRSRIRWSREKNLGLGIVSEDLESGFDHGLGLTGARRTADEVGNSVTGSNDGGNGLPLDCVEILIVEEVEIGYERGSVVFLLRPDPSSKDVVCRLER